MTVIWQAVAKCADSLTVAYTLFSAFD